MSLKYNPTTGKYESRTPVGTQGSQSRPANPSGDVRPPSGREKNAAALATLGKGYPSSPVQPKKPTGTTGTTAVTTRTSAKSIADMIDDIALSASAYYEQTGLQPTAAWYELNMLPISIKLDADAAAVKKAEADAERRANAAVAAAKTAAEKAAAEKERIRAINAGRQAEKFLREQAENVKTSATERIANLFDPMVAGSEEEKARMLESVGIAFDNSINQVKTAQEQFAANFKPSTAYEGAPVATYSVADNPLLAALQSQGAGTAEVSAATDYARQSAQQTSDLEKWAMSQLNIGQQNYGSAVQNAAQQGTMAGLQQLAARRPEVEAGISKQQQEFLDKLNRERAEQTGAADEKYQDLIAEANKIAAGTTADYGNLPKEQLDLMPKMPTVTPKPTPKAAPKPVVKATPQQAESARLAALAKKYAK
jgi:hypothetical protein